MQVVTKAEVLAELRRGGYIKKASSPSKAATTFHCDEKYCSRVLEGEFKLSEDDKSGYRIPTSVQELRDAMERSAAKQSDGSYNAIPDLSRRCFICIYRSYRAVFHRKFGYYRDEDVPNDFSNLSVVKSKPISSSKSKSPKSMSPFWGIPPENVKVESRTTKEVTNFLREYLTGFTHPAWVDAITSSKKVIDGLIDYVDHDLKYGFYFTIVVPSVKIGAAVLAKTDFTPEFMNPKNLEDFPPHPLRYYLDLCHGTISKFSMSGDKPNPLYESNLNYVDTIREAEFHIAFVDNVMYIDGIKVSKRIEVKMEGSRNPIMLIQLHGLLSTVKLNALIKEKRKM